MPKLKMKRFLKKLPPDYAEIYEKGWLHNYTIEYHAEKGTSFPSQVIIGDQTLRDGEQQTGVIFSPEEKVEIAKLFSEMGINTVEIGFPAVSEEEVKACKMIHAENLKFLPFVMCRAKQSDIDKALECDAKAIDLFTSSSEFHIRAKLKITPEENIEMYCKAAEYARDHGLLIIMGREDCSRSHIPYLAKLIVAAKEAAGNKWAGFGISDTTGSLTPTTTIWLYKKIVQALIDEGYTPPPAPGIHCHNDLGLATANTLASIEAGAQGVSGTFTGIGERAGNAPLEEVIMALETLYGINTRIKLEVMVEACELISKYAGVPIPVNKPVIGQNAFKHEAGIHAAGVLAHPYTYETIPHTWLGKESIFRYGKFSGTDVILKDALKDSGLEPNREELLRITMAVKKAQIEKGIEIFRKFVDTYQQTMSQMGLSVEEVVEIAKEIMKK